MEKRTQPIPCILNKKFPYTTAAKTNILETFKRFGWVPPTEKKAKR